MNQLLPGRWRQFTDYLVCAYTVLACPLAGIAIVTAGLAFPAVQAQDFTLFEQVETTATASQPGQQRPTRESRATTAKPDFTLVGTSRIGDSYSVILAHRDGDKVVTRVQPGVNTQVSDHNDYAIVDIAAGKVSIRLPASSPCIEFPESGVLCNSGANIAQLSLATSAPIAAAPPEIQEEVVEEPANPFAVMREAQAADAPPGGRFTPRRIDPEEVPPGMRVVSTPFGDRLVQQ